MSDKILERLLTPRTGDAEHFDTPLDPERSDDLGAFGFLRGGDRARAIMLELRKKTGAVRAIGYAWLERIDYDPSEGITLFASGQKIRLIGSHLNAEIRPNVRLFQGLTRHRIPWVQEASEAAHMQAGERETIIERIEW